MWKTVIVSYNEPVPLVLLKSQGMICIPIYFF